MCAGDGFVAPVSGDEDDGEFGERGDAPHQFDPVDAGEHQVEEHEAGPFGADDAGEPVRIAGDERGVAGVGEGVAHLAQRVPVVVQDHDPLLPSLRARRAPGAAGRRGRGCGIRGRRDREREARAEARPRRSRRGCGRRAPRRAPPYAAEPGDGPRRFVLAGDMGTGPALEFQVPDRRQAGLYSVRVVEVAGADHRLLEPDGYRAAVTR